VLIDVNDVALGHTTKQKWNDPGKWVWSEKPAHELLIDDETFARAQALRRAKGSANERSPRRTARGYALRPGPLRHMRAQDTGKLGPHGIGQRNVSAVPFPNWRFLDFSGFDIASEKAEVAAEIHALSEVFPARTSRANVT
jgi:hypothetical protein